MSKFLVYGLSDGWGGVENIVMAIATRLSDRHEFDILIPGGEPVYGKRFENENVRFLSIASWGGDFRRFGKELEDIMRRGNYNFVWINGCVMSNGTVIRVASRFPNVKIISHSHGSSFEESNKIRRMVLLGLHRLNRPLYHRRVDFPCQCSIPSGQWFYGKRWSHAHDIYYINNGIEIERYRFSAKTRNRLRQQLSISDDMVALFSAGRLSRVKNQAYLIRLIGLLPSNYHLFLAGCGEDEPLLHDEANVRGVAVRVHLLGMRSDVADLYSAMDMFLMPSFHEGFPLVAPEVQAAGLPYIVSTGLPPDVNISGKVQYLPIGEENLHLWRDTVLQQSANVQEREVAWQMVADKGFDIEQVAVDFERHILSKD